MNREERGQRLPPPRLPPPPPPPDLPEKPPERPPEKPPPPDLPEKPPPRLLPEEYEEPRDEGVTLEELRELELFTVEREELLFIPREDVPLVIPE